MTFSPLLRNEKPAKRCLSFGSAHRQHRPVPWFMVNASESNSRKKNTQKLFRIQRCRSQQQLFAASHKNAWLLLAIDWNIMNTFGDEMLCQCSEGTPTIFIYLADVFFFSCICNGKMAN